MRILQHTLILYISFHGYKSGMQDDSLEFFSFLHCRECYDVPERMPFVYLEGTR